MNRLMKIVLVVLVVSEILPTTSGWRRRRRRRRPPPCPYVCSASNPAPMTNPLGLSSSGTGVCRVTEYRSEQYCTPCHCGSCPAYRSQGIQVLRCCRGYQKSGNTCPIKIPCSSPRDVPNGSRSPNKATFAVGEKVTYTCNTHYAPNRATQITCLVGPQWSASAPDCLPKPCSNPPIPAHAAISGGARGSYAVGSTVTMICVSGYRLVSGAAVRTCNLGNRWSGSLVVCKPVCAGNVDVCKNGGSCTSPEFCSNCSPGFYSPRCDACPTIVNCAFSICSHPDPNGSKTCRTCSYDFGNEKGRAYEPSADGKTCLKRCSWRADSNHCYPGECGLVDTCKCATGFTSPSSKCSQIIEHPRINPGFLRFYYGGDLEGQDSRVNVTKSMEEGGRLFTNARIVKRIYVTISANYLKNLPQSPPFIVRKSIGLDTFNLDFKLYHSSGTVTILTLSPSMRDSSGKYMPVYEVDQTVDITSKCGGRPCELKTNDRFRFETVTKNGGFITIRNPETNRDSNQIISGVSSERGIEVNVDRDPPEHGSKTDSRFGEPMTLQPAGVLAETRPVAVGWRGWNDSVSGLGTVHLTVSEMQLAASGMLDIAHGGEHMYHWSTEVDAAAFGSNINLPRNTTAVYEVKVVVCDRVIEKMKNCMATRRFILRDAGTSVTNTSTPMKVSDEVKNGASLWLTKPRSALTLTWTDHFVNQVLESKGLLNEIRGWPINGEERFYDHLRGLRNISKVQNIRGITRFRSQVKVGRFGSATLASFDPDEWHDDGRTLSKAYLYSTLGYVDGQSARFWVEATDFVDHKKIDSVTIHFDSSPPTIGNISLVKDGRPGINVHNSEELFNANFQFHARDTDSGLFTVKWRLYDNFTRTDIVHGTSHLDRQSHATVAACQAAHPSSNCYETAMSGVFADLFQVKINRGDLNPGLDLTQHDHDLQFQVTVENNALLKSQSVFQISIDTSGPHPGHVFDGLVGSPEVNFQSGLTLNGHWKDFYDKESGIAFYKYKYGAVCFLSKDFSLSNRDDETLNNFVSWTAPGAGQYFLTVVAYNNALEPSVPVCSNGVTVDTSPPSIASIDVENLRSQPGLVIDSKRQLWLVDDRRYRRPIANATAACLNRSVTLTNSKLALLPILTIPHRTLPPKELSNEECLAIEGYRETSVLSSDTNLNVSFVTSDETSGIEDSSVALVKAAEDGAPTSGTEEWVSSHGMNRVNLRHPDIRYGARVFVKIRATNRAQLQTISIVGPIIVNVRPPAVTGNLNVRRKGDTAWISRGEAAIVDSVTPFPLQFSLAAGRSLHASDLIKPKSIVDYPVCPGENNCSVVDMTDVPVVSGKTIYFYLQAVNVAGHRSFLSSLPFQWKSFSGSAGILRIIELSSTVIHPELTREISCQSNKGSIQLAWFGFHLSEEIASAAVTIYDRSTGSSVKQESVDFKSSKAIINRLVLIEDKSYEARLTVTTSFGSVFAQSAPVKIMKAGRMFSDLRVAAGDPCKSIVPCTPANVQGSTSHFHVAWTNPAAFSSIHPRIVLEIEILNSKGFWESITSRTILSTSQKNFTFTGLSLYSGQAYRATVQMCVDSVCSENHPSQPVWISVDAPTVHLLNATLLHNDLIQFTVEKFTLRGFVLSQHPTYMSDYKWRLESVHEDGTMDVTWLPLPSEHSNLYNIWGNITLPANLSSTVCVKFVVRGRTKAGVSSTVSKNIGSCKNGHKNFQPRIVIDAKGPLSLGENFQWPHADIDYLVEGGILAAVWPTLRHGSFQYAVLESPWTFRGGFYVTDETELQRPCDHKSAVFCGHTDKRFISLEKQSLKVDRRYHVCIHANRTVRGQGSSRELLHPVSACSSGVTVLSKIPKPGTVVAGPIWTSSTSMMRIQWNSFFSDSATAALPHHTAVKEYFYKIGRSPMADDVVRYTSAGMTQQQTVTGLTLENGENYYVTVKAINIVDVEAEATSQPVGIDLKPPSVTAAHLFFIENSDGVYLTDASVVKLRWTGLFEDAESGLCSYQWCVGSQKGICDVMRPKTTQDTFATDNIDDLVLTGVAYFFGIRAFDCVGHSTLFTSRAYHVVKEGPQTGQVYDGEAGPDKDHQMETDRLSAHWSGFYDEQSGIVEYRVYVGTIRGDDDVISAVSVGLHRSITFNHLELRFGVRYYFGVTACNRAGLCTSTESDGILIDKTPPVLGRVVDGNRDQITMFQHSRSLVEFQLVGFVDLESGLSKIDWCLTRNGTECDVSPVVTMPFAMLIRSQLTSPLPVGVLIRVRVVVHNHVGLKTTALSYGFIVDESPPIFTSPISFDYSEYSLSSGSQVATTRLGLKWRVDDRQSGVWEQFLHVSAHSRSNEVAKMVRIPGFSIGSFVFSKLSLRDGYRYQAKLTACNRAGKCATSTSTEILVDNSPPQVGMFLPRSNASYVHPGDREMKWDTRSVTISWQGFSDAHSGVISYYITVGTRYLSDDLVSATVVLHEKSNREQKKTFTSLKSITAGSTLFISIRAINGANMKSHPLHSAFVAADDKHLDPVRRCKSENCLGHCVCAPLHHSCAPTESCTDLSGRVGDRATISVKDVTSFSDTRDISFTTERCVMAATWTASNSGILRYEVSAGLASSNTPAGLFDAVSERIWFDVGQDNQAVLNLTQRSDKCMKDNTKYKFFVRAWYDTNSFALFTSDGVTPLTDLPQVLRRRGSRMWEADPSSPDRDIDIIVKTTTELFVQWPRQFHERLTGSITSFSVAIGTTCGGADISPIVKLSPTTKSHRFTGIELVHGRSYVSTVLACNAVGLCSLACSDGFKADFTKPIVGIVVNSLTGLTHQHYQSNQSHVASSWLDFTDPESSVSLYEWCLDSTSSPTNCTYVNWKSMGLHNHARTLVSSSKVLSHGEKVFSHVRAQNPAGPSSSVIATGQSLIVDVVPPYLIGACKGSDTPTFKNNIFSEFEGDWKKIGDLDQSWWQNTTSTVKDWSLSASSQAQIVKSVFSQDGDYFVLVHGSIKQAVATTPGTVYSLEFYVADVNNWSEQSTKRGYVEIGDAIKHSFSVQGRKSSTDVHLIWVKKFYHFKASSPSTTISIGTLGVDVEGLGIDSVVLKPCTSSSTTTTESSLTVSAEHADGKVRVLASWAAHDDLSGQAVAKWALGTVPGGIQLQSYTHVDPLNSNVHTPLYTIPQKTPLHFSLLLIDRAGSASLHHAKAVLLDFTSPEVQLGVSGKDCVTTCVANNGRFKIAVHASDKESGISKCSIAIGTTPQSEDIQPYKTLKPSEGSRDLTAEVSFNLTAKNGQIVYPTIVCLNRNGIGTTKSLTHGIRIVTEPPSSASAFVRVVTPSKTHFPRVNPYQSDQSTLAFTFGKFIDVSGADFHYDYSLQGPTGSPYQQSWRQLAESRIRMVILEDLNLVDGTTYTLSVRAVNQGQLMSHPVSTNVTIDSSPPTMNPDSFSVVSTSATSVKVDWSSVYQSSSSLFYEVSVGSGVGKSDIFGLIETRRPVMVMNNVDQTKTYHLSITAISNSGLFTRHVFLFRGGTFLRS